MKTKLQKFAKKAHLLLIISVFFVMSVPSFAKSDLFNHVATTQLTCEEARFVKLINLYRLQLHLSVLGVAGPGVEAARWHAFNMGSFGYFDHTEPNGRTAFERMASFNYPGQAENIAAGNSDAGKTFCQWRLSAGHDRNMRGINWTTLSIGEAAVSSSQYKYYWSSGFSSKVTEILSEPLAPMAGCAIPDQLPSCSKN